jgi:hypothetical protein
MKKYIWLLPVLLISKRGFVDCNSDLRNVSNLGTIVKQLMGSLDGKYTNKLETLSVMTTYNWIHIICWV